MPVGIWRAKLGLRVLIVTVNYSIIIINACYNCINIAWYNSIAKKGLLKECGKEENVEVTGAATTSCVRGRL